MLETDEEQKARAEKEKEEKKKEDGEEKTDDTKEKGDDSKEKKDDAKEKDEKKDDAKEKDEKKDDAKKEDKEKGESDKTEEKKDEEKMDVDADKKKEEQIDDKTKEEKKDAKDGEKEEAMETEDKKGDDWSGEYGEWAPRCTLVKPDNLVDKRSSEEISRSRTAQKYCTKNYKFLVPFTCSCKTHSPGCRVQKWWDGEASIGRGYFIVWCSSCLLCVVTLFCSGMRIVSICHAMRERRLCLWTASRSSLQTRPWGGLL